MHIADGVVSLPVLVTSTAIAATGVGIGLKQTDYKQIPQVAVLTAGFFIASLIHIPLGPGQVHLLMNGLTGIILGWAAFPALLVALFLQALLFGYGGITVLGVNTVNMALPALCCHYLFTPLLRKELSRRSTFLIAFAAGGSAVAASGVLLAATLFFSNREFTGVATAILFAHLPVMVVEGVLTGSAVVFLKRVQPDFLTPNNSL
ncbi:MAG: cobalt transporter CbiM [Desulfobulbaceae bacterium]|nr:cobalt transporter CbiM [Desulfobulbaceae bacterium]